MDHAALLAAVAAAPDDDTPRLVLADWLDDHGDPDRAAFVRAQVGAARLPPGDARLPGLRARAADLLAVRGPDWCAPLGLDPAACTFRRGLVEAVEVRADRFLADPAALFRAAPVREVHFLHATAALRDLAASPSLGRLHTLDLSGNAIRDDGAAVLAASHHLGRLVVLDLGGCEVHADGAAHLAAADLRGLRALRLAGCGITADGLRAVLESPGLSGLEELDVRGNHQGWVAPVPGEPWMTLTEPNVGDDGVRLPAGSPAAARFGVVDVGLNQLTSGTADALVASPHLAGVRELRAFETDHVYTAEGPPLPPGGPRTPNEMIADVLCESIPGYARRPLARVPGDPRFEAPPCTIGADVVGRLRDRFGPRLSFAPPAVRYGAHFQGARDDWYGLRAVLTTGEG